MVCAFTGTGAEGFFNELRNTAALTGPLRALPGVLSALVLALALPGVGLAADSAMGDTRGPAPLEAVVSMLRPPRESIGLLLLAILFVVLLFILLAHLLGTTAEGNRAGGAVFCWSGAAVGGSALCSCEASGTGALYTLAGLLELAGTPAREGTADMGGCMGAPKPFSRLLMWLSRLPSSVCCAKAASSTGLSADALPSSVPTLLVSSCTA